MYLDPAKHTQEKYEEKSVEDWEALREEDEEQKENEEDQEEQDEETGPKKKKEKEGKEGRNSTFLRNLQFSWLDQFR